MKLMFSLTTEADARPTSRSQPRYVKSDESEAKSATKLAHFLVQQPNWEFEWTKA
jgi:hypothetical protein